MPEVTKQVSCRAKRGAWVFFPPLV